MALDQTRVFEALWEVVGHKRALRFVVIRDWPGHIDLRMSRRRHAVQRSWSRS
jgi:hypothetical protein